MITHTRILVSGKVYRSLTTGGVTFYVPEDTFGVERPFDPVDRIEC